jgi:hypothetical protein
MQIVTYAECHLVQRHSGTMPVILTCPHDGDQSPPGVDARTDEATPPGCQFAIADTIRLVNRNRQFLIEDLAIAIINFVRRHATF